MLLEAGVEEVRSEFVRRFAGQPRIFQAPGRINLVGEHTDYNGGLVFPATVDRYTWVAISPRDDGILRVHLCSEDRTHMLQLDRISKGDPCDSIEYVKGVVWALQQERLAPGGADLLIFGNIPLGAGLSSSASLQIALAFALLDAGDREVDRSALAKICHRSETEFVGLQCGIMDQYVIALGATGEAMLLDCSSLEFALVGLPRAAQFLVVDSGVKRKLAASAYNQRREECASALTALRSEHPGLINLAEMNMDQFQASAHLLKEPLLRRCRHVVSENQRVRSAKEALETEDLPRLGQLLQASHASLRDDYEVSCTELDALVDIAMDCNGVLGARMMGAGFGGCMLGLVEADAMDETMDIIARRYGRVLGRPPWMHCVGPASGVRRVERDMK